MLTRPVSIIRLLEPFGTIFQAKTWEKAQLLLVGAILSPGKRTVTSALRVMGLSRDGNFARYHHVLNRARWSSLQLSRTLLFLLLRHLDSGIGPLVFGIDETIERRRGKRISAKGIYRDGVRSSQGHFVKASGLRWVSVDVVGPHSLGRPGLGLAFPDGVGTFGAVSPGTGAAAQKAHRLGPPDDSATPALVAPATPGTGSRQQLRRSGLAALLPIYGLSCDFHHPAASGCRSIRTGSTSLPWPVRASPAQG